MQLQDIFDGMLRTFRDMLPDLTTEKYAGQLADLNVVSFTTPALFIGAASGGPIEARGQMQKWPDVEFVGVLVTDETQVTQDAVLPQIMAVLHSSQWGLEEARISLPRIGAWSQVYPAIDTQMAVTAIKWEQTFITGDGNAAGISLL